MIPIPSELYPDIDKPQIDLPYLPPPSSFIAQFEQLRTEKQYANEELQKKEKSLSNHLAPILEKVSKCELLAFDFAVFLDPSNSDRIQKLFQDCFSMNDGKYGFDFTNVKSVANHIRSLISFITECNAHIQKQQLFFGSRFCIAENFKNFHGFLRQSLNNSETYFSTVQERLNNNPFSLNIPINLTANVETESKEFANWLLSQYPTPHSIQIKQLVNRLAYRLTTIFNLQETVTRYRELSSICDTSKYTEFYSAEAIMNSPQYQSLTNKITFFSYLLKNGKLDEITEFVYQLKRELDNNWSQYESKMAWEEQKIDKDIQALTNGIAENRKQLDERLKILTPMARNYFDIAQKFSPNSSRCLSFAIPQTIDSLKRKFTEPNIVNKMDRIYTLNHEIELIYQEGLRYVNKIMTLQRQIADFNYKEDDEQLSAFKKMVEYRDKQIRNHLSQVHERNNRLNEIHTMLTSLANLESKIEHSLIKAIEQFSHENESQVASPSPDELDGKREQLLQKIKEFDEKIIYLQQSVYDINEKKASMGQTVSGPSESASPVNQVYQNSFYQMERRITCPVCNINRRTILIESCGHVVCEACFEKNRKKRNPACPFCKRIYRSDEYEELA